MLEIPGFEMPGYELDMYPGDHFPHHFHLSCAEFDIRILYRKSYTARAVKFTLVWRKGRRKQWKPLSDQEERVLLVLIDQFYEELEAEWIRLHQ